MAATEKNGIKEDKKLKFETIREKNVYFKVIFSSIDNSYMLTLWRARYMKAGERRAF